MPKAGHEAVSELLNTSTGVCLTAQLPLCRLGPLQQSPSSCAHLPPAAGTLAQQQQQTPQPRPIQLAFCSP